MSTNTRRTRASMADRHDAKQALFDAEGVHQDPIAEWDQVAAARIQAERWRRQAAEDFARRRSVTMTTFVEPATKADLNAVYVLGMNLLSSKRFTESAILRALAEIVVDLDIDWAAELAGLPEDLSWEPLEAIRWIVRKHVSKIAATPEELEQNRPNLEP